ncbi:hypothetical protein [Rhizosaccharibacter radicis]|uniref:Lantibiotic dehydratase N-terminal domain-containing protein n=1 Tax=Rhizosaccharibacter radicis TaxID=2782605 RepID=A0ABT1VSI3_9PROT|nr:hypothetical protein [Acetobacteraceae bacterium KSS12]
MPNRRHDLPCYGFKAALLHDNFGLHILAEWRSRKDIDILPPSCGPTMFRGKSLPTLRSSKPLIPLVEIITEIREWIEACLDTVSDDLAERTIATCPVIGAKVVRNDPGFVSITEQLLAIPSRSRACPAYLRAAFVREQLILLREAVIRHSMPEPAPPPDRVRGKRSRLRPADRLLPGEWITLGVRFTELAHRGVYTVRTLIEVWLVPADSTPEHPQRPLLLSEVQNTSRDACPDPVRIPGERFIGTIGFRTAQGNEGAFLLSSEAITDRTALPPVNSTIESVDRQLREARFIDPTMTEICVTLDAAVIGVVGGLPVLSRHLGQGTVLPLFSDQLGVMSPLRDQELSRTTITWNGFYAVLLSTATRAGWFFDTPTIRTFRYDSENWPPLSLPETAARPPFTGTTGQIPSLQHYTLDRPYLPLSARLALYRLCRLPWSSRSDLSLLFSAVSRHAYWVGFHTHVDDLRNGSVDHDKIDVDIVERYPRIVDDPETWPFTWRWHGSRHAYEKQTVLRSLRELRERDPGAGRDEVVRIVRERKDIARNEAIAALRVNLSVEDIPALQKLLPYSFPTRTSSPPTDEAYRIMRVCPGTKLYEKRLALARRDLQIIRTMKPAEADPAGTIPPFADSKMVEFLDGFDIDALMDGNPPDDLDPQWIARHYPYALRALAGAALRGGRVPLAVRLVRALPRPDWPQNAISALPADVERYRPSWRGSSPHPCHFFIESCFDPDGTLFGSLPANIGYLAGFIAPTFSAVFVKKLTASSAFKDFKTRITARNNDNNRNWYADSHLFGLAVCCGEPFEEELSYLPLEHRRLSTSFFDFLRCLRHHAPAGDAHRVS